jgi:hypothetical protein
MSFRNRNLRKKVVLDDDGDEPATLQTEPVSSKAKDTKKVIFGERVQIRCTPSQLASKWERWNTSAALPQNNFLRFDTLSETHAYHNAKGSHVNKHFEHAFRDFIGPAIERRKQEGERLDQLIRGLGGA